VASERLSGFKLAMADHDVTRVLEAMKQGDSKASKQLLPLVYEELRRLARQNMAREGSSHTLQATALVHEAWMRLAGDGTMRWESRGHFYAAAAESMRRILIEAARRKASLKRGGDRVRVQLAEDEIQAAPTASDSLLALNEALQKLEVEDPESFRLVMLRNFGGLTVEEAAEAMGISARTAKRLWSFARAWLQREIDRK
jgi:RNA polymerase sigma factor (TIGR02999 family)